MPDKQKILAIIQARAGSTRLPGKVLKDLAGKTVLERVIERVKASKLINDVVVATTVNKEDLAIVKLCSDNNVSIFCGSEDDVLDRYYQAARLFGADHVVRITSDCPLIDPAIIDLVIDRHLRENADYTSNTLKETFPDGEDVEIMTFTALKQAWQQASLTSEREHVTPFIRKNAGLFKLAVVINDENLSDKRWTLDNEEDYAFLKHVYSHFQGDGQLFGMSDVLAVIKENPHYEKMNKHISRNEGMVKSLREDRVLERTEEDVNG